RASHRADRRRKTSSIHYILGLDFLASRQIDRAVSELTLAARKDTEAIEIYLILGNLLREKGQLERAIQIHQSILHRPGLSGEERAHALLCLGMDFKRAGFRNRAMDTFQEVVALDPENAYALSNLIKIHEAEHDWERALETQETLFQVSGELDTALKAFLYDQIGQAAAQAEEGLLAVRAFEDAIRTEPQVSAPYLHYGDMLENQGRFEEAEAKWLAMASDNPRLAYLVFDRLRRVREKLGRGDAMTELFKSVIDADDNDWRAHLALARDLKERGESDDAFNLLMEAVRTNPHALAVHVEVWRSLVSMDERTDRVQTYLDEVERSAFFLDPYICMKCNYRANGILWRCPHCQEWNTFIEERVETVDR
ncbi:unnamed protein product, partial [marine sediment metagenome]